MANTFKDAKITEVAINSQSSTTGEIRTTEIDADGSSLETTPEGNTDPDGATAFTSEELDFTLVLMDHDFLFTDTMNDSTTAEETMPAKLYVQIVCEDGTLVDSSGTQWHEVRATTSEVGDITDASDKRKGELSGILRDHGGNFKLN
jgi:hypothetical protein